MNAGSTSYEVALSFASEQRRYVEEVADGLKARGITVFYDGYEEATLWGKNLYDHLTRVYSKMALHTVLFISKQYAAKVWTNHERRAAQARALTGAGEYLLPARFDDTEIEGLPPTVSYVDLRHKTPAELCVLICQKLGYEPFGTKADLLPPPQSRVPAGVVTFDYSSHNGLFRIGEGNYLFETQWSKASDTSIYCLNDPPSLRGVALAPRNVRLTDLTDVNQLDFTSRSRCPEEERFVVLQNTHGFFALVKIEDVKDDTRADDRDELTFRYWILRDGTSNFAAVAETANPETLGPEMKSDHPRDTHSVEGEDVFNGLKRDYPRLAVMVHGAGTSNPTVGLFLPEASWTALSRPEQISLTHYVEDFIPKVRADPDAFVGVSRQAPAYDQLRANTAAIQDGSWFIGVGRPNAQGDGVMFDREVVLGDTAWTARREEHQPFGFSPPEAAKGSEFRR